MSGPRIVDVNGEVGVFVPASQALALAVSVRRLVDARPAEFGQDPVLVPFARLLLVASKRQADREPRAASGPTDVVDLSQFVSTQRASLVLGIDPRSVRKRIERGTVPAIKHGDRWLIPIDSLPHEDGHDDVTPAEHREPDPIHQSAA